MKHIRLEAIMAKQNPEQLKELAHLIAEDKIKVNIARIYDFNLLPEALMYLKDNSVRGKLVLRVQE
jgi:NADPH-dependent curcumin reductase CurA